MPTLQIENDEKDKPLSDGSSDDDDGDDDFADDMASLRQACLIAGKDVNRLDDDNAIICCGSNPSSPGSEDDLELLRGVRERFLLPDEMYKPLCALPPESDEDGEDDLETLTSIQRRFAAYIDSDAKGEVSWSKKSEMDPLSSIGTSEANVSDISLVGKTNAIQVVEDFEDNANTTNLLSDSVEMQPAGSVVVHQSAACQSSTVATKYFRSPETFQVIFGAIKKNRALQNLIQAKLCQIEARLEENDELRKRMKMLKSLEVSCRKNTGRNLAQGKNPLIQLISTKPTTNSKDSKAKDTKASAICSGPVENSQAPYYREALEMFPFSFEQRKWDEREDKKLKEGLEQQYQEMLSQAAMEQVSSSGSGGQTNDLDSILKSIKDLEITPQMMKQFLPKVDWDKLAFMNVESRSGAECQARWLNSSCPLINKSGWSKQEQKLLYSLTSSKGIQNWSEIASLLGTNRTPFQCLERFQRSLNPRVLKSQWTKEEDAQLRAAVQKFGECNWQSVAATLRERTGTQCSNRWKKSLRLNGKGTWKTEEDKRLKLAVKFFGPKDWKKVAQFVPGRKDVQCRERWHNSCSPSLNRGAWSEEEDLQLKAAFEEHGHCWSKISHHLPGRTDNECMRRWKVLFPEAVPLLEEARKLRKAALITNFVDREEERPALGPEDFAATSIGLLPQAKNVDESAKSKRKPRRKTPSTTTSKEVIQRNTEKRTRPKRTRRRLQGCSQPDRVDADDIDAESCGGNTTVGKKRSMQSPVRRNHIAEQTREQSVDSISSPAARNRILLVYTRKKKGLGDLHASKDNLESTDAQVEEPLFDETTSIKKAEALGSHKRKENHQMSGVTEEDNDTSSSLLECGSKKKKKRKLEVGRNSSQASSLTDDNDAGMCGSELRRVSSMSADILSEETSSHIIVYCRRKQQTEEPIDWNWDRGIIIDDDIPLARALAAAKLRNV
ncbi:unnamed protein product [Linum tenue]|uniref:Uncharacterized protein n=1 Tax=Linum tenue TaxID=586396 RepID=A0AAV0H946_9ROSI|nr:unnamed protein product [Linum tenue]